MARTTPRVQQGQLHIHQSEQAIVVDSPAWFAWLTGQHVFSFTSPAGSFTARRERRASGWYWYAYRRQRGSLRSAYLGKASDLTLARLTEIAGTLNTDASASLPASEGLRQPFLLATKITPPPLASTVIVRARLNTSLNASIAQRLILVTGLPGSGKTTLLNVWQRKLTCQVAWVSLDEDDNNLVRFWNYVLAALRKQASGFADHLLAQLATLQRAAWEPFLALLINALATLPGRVVLVLDDYHLLTNEAIHESLTFLLLHAPEQFCLVVSSRTLPPFPLPRLRTNGFLTELSAIDLRFTSREAEDLLRALINDSLTFEDLSQVLEYTEGWVTGLTLAAQAWRGRQRGSAYAAFSRGVYYTSFEYLASEVLAHQSEQIQTFLLRTSVLERLNGALCDAVTLQDQSRNLLQQLEQENLFLSPLDDRRLWYRYHQLFADFLRNRLEQTSPELLATLHRRAAVWYAGHAMPADAITSALRAQDYTLAAQFIEAQGREVLMKHEVISLATWVGALPEELVYQHPRLCIYVAWALLHTTHPLPVERYLNAAERELDHAHISESERRTLDGEIMAIRARVAIYQGKIEQSVFLARQALHRLAENENLVRGEVALSLGTASEALGDTQTAEEAYRDAIKSSKHCDNLRATMLAIRSLATLRRDQGRLHLAHGLYEDGLEYALQQRQEHLPPVGFLYVGLGELYYEWNELEAAERHLHQGIALGQRGGDVKVWLLGFVGLMFTSLARGDSERSWQLFKEANHLARQTNFRRGIALLKLIRLYLSGLQGDLIPLLVWAEECGLDPAKEPGLLLREEYHLLARAFIARNEPDQALPILHHLLGQARHASRFGDAIAIALDLARAYTLAEAMAQASEALDEALALGEPQGYIRTFVDGGREVAALLRKRRQTFHQRDEQAARPCSPGYLDRLLQAFRDDRPRLEGDGLAEQISQRELEVLHLLAAGHSNAEIAERLIVGLNTVKTHLKNIYGKLEVHNRTQAIAQARTLQLL